MMGEAVEETDSSDDDDEDKEVGSSIGVRQGACEGPILFLFITQAALERVKWPVTKPTFRIRADGVTSGERSNCKRGVASPGFAV